MRQRRRAPLVAVVAALALAAPVAAAAPVGGSAAAAAAAAGQLPAVFSTSGFPFAVAAETVIAVPEGSLVRVDELVVGQSQSHHPISDLTLPLPRGATSVRLQEGAPAARFRVAAGRVDLGPVGAGAAVRAAVSYAVPEREGALWLPVGYPTVYVFVLVPHGRWRVLGPGFTFHGTDRLGPLELDAYVTAAPTPGAQLPVRLAPPRPWRALGLCLVGAALLVGAWSGFARWRGRIRPEGERLEHRSETAGAAPRG